ncbi:Fc.00g008390.m01.CDS01 [Cosmosporella sp. VM-42]
MSGPNCDSDKTMSDTGNTASSLTFINMDAHDIEAAKILLSMSRSNETSTSGNTPDGPYPVAPVNIDPQDGESAEIIIDMISPHDGKNNTSCGTPNCPNPTTGGAPRCATCFSWAAALVRKRQSQNPIQQFRPMKRHKQ